MNHHLITIFSGFILLATAEGQDFAVALSAKSAAPTLEAADWKQKTISPVADMLEFEDPVIRSEIRPVFMYQNMDNDSVTRGGYALLAGAQVRLALTDRFAVIVTKGGYMDSRPAAGVKAGGWANLTGGFKYALVDDPAARFILTGGLTYTATNGDESIFHGMGSGLLSPFASFQKGWGDFHLMGTLVYSQALDTDANSSILHYGLHADYHVCQWFIPFVSAVAWTVTDAGKAVPLNQEGYDAINFGASGSDGTTQVVLGLGFRSRLTQNFDIGIAYQKSVAKPRGLFDDRITLDFAIRF
jgi:hypothetical protein